jgi:hypothetical protein
MCNGYQIKISKEEVERKKERKKEGELCVIHHQYQYKNKDVPVLMKHYHDGVWALEIDLLHQTFLTQQQ